MSRNDDISIRLKVMACDSAAADDDDDWKCPSRPGPSNRQPSPEKRMEQWHLDCKDEAANATKQAIREHNINMATTLAHLPRSSDKQERSAKEDVDVLNRLQEAACRERGQQCHACRRTRTVSPLGT
jgi:hypothetical protein